MNISVQVTANTKCFQSSRSSFGSYKVSPGNGAGDKAPVCPTRTKSNDDTNNWKDYNTIEESTKPPSAIVSDHTKRENRIIPFSRSSSRSSIIIDPVCSHRSFNNGHWTDTRKSLKSYRSTSTLSSRSSFNNSFADDVFFDDFIDELEYQTSTDDDDDEHEYDMKSFADHETDADHDDDDDDHSFYIDTNSNVFRTVYERKLSNDSSVKQNIETNEIIRKDTDICMPDNIDIELSSSFSSCNWSRSYETVDESASPQHELIFSPQTESYSIHENQLSSVSDVYLTPTKNTNTNKQKIGAKTQKRFNTKEVIATMSLLACIMVTSIECITLICYSKLNMFHNSGQSSAIQHSRLLQFHGEHNVLDVHPFANNRSRSYLRRHRSQT